MKLRVDRIAFTETYTIGKLYIDGVYFCDTLEDKYRDLSKEVKVYGETAIPTGKYKFILNLSNRFKRIMPLILNVPNFEGIRIHSGNVDTDTHGCLLVGENKEKGKVLNSKAKFEELMSVLLKSGLKEFDIEYINKL